MQHADAGHRLYSLYETLPSHLQRSFLQELLQKQHAQLDDLAFYLACKQAKDEDDFLSESETQAFMDHLPR